MKKPKGFWRPLVAVGLVSGMLALPLSHAVAEQRQQYPPISPYSQQEQDAQERRNSSSGWWIIPALVVGCLVLGCLGGSGQGQGSPSTQDPRRWREEERQQKPESARPDTSIGCAWGDRAYGTCH